MRTKTGEPMRFLQRLIGSTETSCVLWPYAKYPSGYGVIHYQGRSHSAHSVMLVVSGIDRPSKKHVAAHCPVYCTSRSCVNPNHIRWATAQENSDDMKIAGTRTGPIKTTPAMARLVLYRWKTGSSGTMPLAAQIAEDFGISVNTVYKLVNRQHRLTRRSSARPCSPA